MAKLSMKQSVTRIAQLFSVVFSDFFLFDSLLGTRLEGLDRSAQPLLHVDHKFRVTDGAFSTLRSCCEIN